MARWKVSVPSGVPGVGLGVGVLVLVGVGVGVVGHLLLLSVPMVSQQRPAANAATVCRPCRGATKGRLCEPLLLGASYRKEELWSCLVTVHHTTVTFTRTYS